MLLYTYLGPSIFKDPSVSVHPRRVGVIAAARASAIFLQSFIRYAHQQPTGLVRVHERHLRLCHARPIHPPPPFALDQKLAWKRKILLSSTIDRPFFAPFED